MNTNQALQLSKANEDEITEQIVRVYKLPLENLNVLHEQAFASTKTPNKFCFYVLDTKNNQPYGITAILKADGSLDEYRWGMID
jgi:hypothetical protein